MFLCLFYLQCFNIYGYRCVLFSIDFETVGPPKSEVRTRLVIVENESGGTWQRGYVKHAGGDCWRPDVDVWQLVLAAVR